MGILKAIGQGLEMRADGIETSEEEQGFAIRVRSDLRKLDIGEWRKGQTFEMTTDEASFAVDAIRDRSVYETVKPLSEQRDMAILVANGARPKIEAFIEQHAA